MQATKRLLITGGATGLGKALALCWAQHAQQESIELKICIADINEMRGKETEAELNQLGVAAFYQHCDITEIHDINALQTEIRSRWQGVDIVINNAGVATGGSLKSEPLNQWKWVFDINLFGMVQMCQVFVDDFRAQGSGQFINVASQAGITPIPLMSSYNAVKAAVVSFSETLKLELAADNIDVSVVCPSFFKTNLDESLKATEPMAKEMVQHFFSKAQITAQDVAEYVYEQANKRRFMIVTHKEGRRALNMKRYLPNKWYFGQVIKATKKLVLKARKQQ